ncbi:co-chaperone GroES [Anaerotignum sp.]|uniref:co-chaperone GroES n=1 Tax=Anaerotignum sp. TaxID=2039241 RepID=UPI0028B1F362|nr:co-chaperone GroES [Anaerotignum sp.]
MKLSPLGDKVVLKQLAAEETTKSGLILTSQSKEKPQEAIVVAVGPGGIVGDTKIEMVLKEGDHVIYSRYGAMEIKFDGEEYLVMRQNDILAVVKD